MNNFLAGRDARVCWHPYTQAATEPEPFAVSSASGAILTLDDGTELIDGISSWWATLHGHGEERLVQSATEQFRRLDHVLFAGATHEPAVALAEELVRKAPPGLSRCFYSDNGSTAVEVALKMVLQAHAQRGQPKRRVFVALDGGYHGDTFGAMSVGDPEPFFPHIRRSDVPCRARTAECRCPQGCARRSRGGGRRGDSGAALARRCRDARPLASISSAPPERRLEHASSCSSPTK